MSCGQIVLRELGIGYDTYFASEIDKHCIRQTQLNFPDTVQLGDIEKWREWSIDWKNIDIILSGTPCTGFSIAGRRLGFDDSESRLFFVFSDILEHARQFNPDVLYLFENVKMKKQHVRIISERIGIYPVLINSALVSAQNRERYYWSNIRTGQSGIFGNLYTGIPKPKDRGIFIFNIIEKEVDKKYFISDTVLNWLLKNIFISTDGKAPTQRSINGRCPDKKHNYQIIRLNDTKLMTEAQTKILERGRGYDGYDSIRVRELKSSTLTSGNWPHLNYLLSETGIRRLTPTECARLQTVPEWYKWDCSNTQQYRMLGNGWTIEVIKHILSYLPDKFFNNKKNEKKVNENESKTTAGMGKLQILHTRRRI
jgi:DNA (cytosine-5)-methyltransferase 3A